MSAKKAQARLDESRRRFEHQLQALRRAAEREVGIAPNLKKWGVPLLAFAGGLALAAGAFARGRRKRLRE